MGNRIRNLILVTILFLLPVQVNAAVYTFGSSSGSPYNFGMGNVANYNFGAEYGSELAPDNCATSLGTEENDLDNWTNGTSPLNTFESSGVEKQDGLYSLHGVVTADGERCYFTVATVVGKTYLLDAYYIVTNGDAGTGIKVEIGESESDSTNLLVGGLIATSWTQIQPYFTATVTTTYITIRETGADNDADFHIDAASVKEQR